MERYIKEVKAWANKVQDLVKEHDIRNEDYQRWNQEMEKFITKLDGEQHENDLSVVYVQEIENQADALYEKSKALVDEFSVNNRLEMQRRIPFGEHTLPPLPYSYNALEPHINEEIMRLHHDKHHKSYVEGLNKAEKKMVEARRKGNFQLLKHWEREAAFHGSGHYLHTIFWNNMSPNGGGNPKGTLLKQIEVDFGSVSAFKRHFTEAAKQVEGVGWAILVWSPRSHRLEILQSEKHQFFTQWDTIPLLVLDVWEHAYYLQYKTERAEYIKSWWNIVNWRNVEKRFKAAQQLKWKPY